MCPRVIPRYAIHVGILEYVCTWLAAGYVMLGNVPRTRTLLVTPLDALLSVLFSCDILTNTTGKKQTRFLA